MRVGLPGGYVQKCSSMCCYGVVALAERNPAEHRLSAGIENARREVPLEAVRKASYSAGMGRKAGTVWRYCRGTVRPLKHAAVFLVTPMISRADTFEAEVDGLTIGCIYLPNGNPAPGPKFDYKLARGAHPTRRAQAGAMGQGCGFLSGDPRCIRQIDRAGLDGRDSRKRPGEALYTYWDYFRNAFGRDADNII